MPFKRNIAFIESGYYQITVFHFCTGGGADVDSYNSIIVSAEMIYEFETGDSGDPVFPKALIANIDLVDSGSALSLTEMLFRKDSNYDATYTNVAGKALFYVKIYDKINAVSTYLKFLESGNEFAQKSGIRQYRLSFSDGLVDLEGTTQWNTDKTTKKSAWTSACGTTTADKKYPIVLTKELIDDYCFDSDLSATTTIPATTYQHRFYDYSEAGAPPYTYFLLSAVYFRGDVLSFGATYGTETYQNAVQLLKDIHYDLGLLLVSNGISSFELRGITFFSPEALSINLFEQNTLSIQRDAIQKKLTTQTPTDPLTTTSYYYTYGDTAYTLRTKYLSNVEYSLGGFTDYQNLYGFLGGVDTKMSRSVGISGSPLTLGAGQITDGVIGLIRAYQFLDYASLADQNTYGSPGLKIKFSKPTFADIFLGIVKPYSFVYNGRTIYFMPTKIQRDLLAVRDEVEGVSVCKKWT